MENNVKLQRILAAIIPLLLLSGGAFAESAPTANSCKIKLPTECPTTAEVAILLETCGVEELAAESILLGGFAKFVSARAKEEARIWVTESMMTKICEAPEKVPDKGIKVSRYLFPNSCSLIEGMAAAGSVVPLDSTIRAIKEDIKYLPACVLYQETKDKELKVRLLGYKKLSKHYRHSINETNGSAADATTAPIASDADFSGVGGGLAAAGAGEAAALNSRLTISDVTNSFDGDYLNAVVNATEGKYSEAFVLLGPKIGCTVDGDEKPMCRFGGAMAALAEAETQEDVSNALDNFASPLGSWRRKAMTPMWSVTALAGAQAGVERLKGSGDEVSHGTSGMLGVTGLQYTWPWGRGYGGVMLSAIDIGAMLSWSEESELGGGETSADAETSLSSVVSPGVYLSYTLAHSPLTLGIGASRTPNLRSVKFDGGSEENVDSERVLAFIAIDVTIFGW
jgi:hypothetical protein